MEQPTCSQDAKFWYNCNSTECTERTECTRVRNVSIDETIAPEEPPASGTQRESSKTKSGRNSCFDLCRHASKKYTGLNSIDDGKPGSLLALSNQRNDTALPAPRSVSCERQNFTNLKGSKAVCDTCGKIRKVDVANRENLKPSKFGNLDRSTESEKSSLLSSASKSSVSDYLSATLQEARLTSSSGSYVNSISNNSAAKVVTDNSQLNISELHATGINSQDISSDFQSLSKRHVTNHEAKESCSLSHFNNSVKSFNSNAYDDFRIRDFQDTPYSESHNQAQQNHSTSLASGKDIYAKDILAGPGGAQTTTTTLGKLPGNKLSLKERKRIVISSSRPPALTKAMRLCISRIERLLDPFREDDDCWLHPSPPSPQTTPNGMLRAAGKLQKAFTWNNRNGKHSIVLNYGTLHKLANHKMTKQQKDGIVNKSWHLSHLCGNWTCLNPSHTTIEPGWMNISRNPCFSHRSGCRHHPPCMKDKKVPLGVDGRPIVLEDSYTSFLPVEDSYWEPQDDDYDDYIDKGYSFECAGTSKDNDDETDMDQTSIGTIPYYQNSGFDCGQEIGGEGGK